jgi:hypothetical protein
VKRDAEHANGTGARVTSVQSRAAAITALREAVADYEQSLADTPPLAAPNDDVLPARKQ